MPEPLEPSPANVMVHGDPVVSDITPTASLLIIGTVVIATAGTGSIWAYLIGCLLAINVAFCMGELGSTAAIKSVGARA